MHLNSTRDLFLHKQVGLVTSLFTKTDHEHFSPELACALGQSAVVKILDEQQAGGAGRLAEVIDTCRRLAHTDASLGWVAGVVNSAWLMRGYFSHLSLEHRDTQGKAMLAMVLGRPGLLQKKPSAKDKWVLNGTWKYASAFPYAHGFFCLAAVEGATPPCVKVIAVPASQLEVVEEWRSVGLRATQSVTVLARDIAVADNHVADYRRILSGDMEISATTRSYAGLFTGVLMNCLLGAILGATEGAINFVIKNYHRPVTGSTYAAMQDSGAMRHEIGRISSFFDILLCALRYNTDILDKAADNPQLKLSTLDRVNIRGRSTQIMRGCVDIVQDLLWLYGSSGLEAGCYLERVWRDVNVGARHGGFAKLIPEETVGRVLLKQDPAALTHMF